MVLNCHSTSSSSGPLPSHFLSPFCCATSAWEHSERAESRGQLGSSQRLFSTGLLLSWKEEGIGKTQYISETQNTGLSQDSRTGWRGPQGSGVKEAGRLGSGQADYWPCIGARLPLPHRRALNLHEKITR